MPAIESTLNRRLQGYIQAIESLSDVDDVRGKKVLRAIVHEDGTQGIESVYHRDITWTWLESLYALFGMDSYNLPRIVHVIQDSNLLAGTDLHKARYLAFILNHRIEHYNAKRWVFTIERVDFDAMIEQTAALAKSAHITPGGPIEMLSEEEQHQFALYDAHLKNLQKSIAMTANTAKANIQKWKLAHANLSTDLTRVFPKAVPAALQEQCTFIKELIQALELSLALNRAEPTPRYEVNRHNTLVMPRDGNCLYHCLRQITNKSIPELRKEAAVHLKANFRKDGHLNGLLRDAVWDVNGGLTNTYYQQVLNLFQMLYDSCSTLDEETGGEWGEKAWDCIRPVKDNMKTSSAQVMREAVAAASRTLQVAVLELRLVELVTNTNVASDVRQALGSMQERFREWHASKEKSTQECTQILNDAEVVMRHYANLRALSNTAEVRAIMAVVKTLEGFAPSLKAIEEEISAKKIPELDDESAILAYIERVETDKFWGGAAELTALATIHKLQIKVTHQPNPKAPRVVHEEMMASLAPRALSEGTSIELDFENACHWNIQL